MTYRKRTRRPIEDRYWPKVDRSGGPDACWEWTARCGNLGYGQFWDGTYNANGNPCMRSAHRWAYQHFIRKLAADECVLHRCDNPPCQNPSHWFIGTHADNALDRERKGRGSRNLIAKPGESNPAAKLTWPDIHRLRALRASGWKQSALAAEFGVSIALISMIVNHKLWREDG